MTFAHKYEPVVYYNPADEFLNLVLEPRMLLAARWSGTQPQPGLHAFSFNPLRMSGASSLAAGYWY